MTYTIHAVARYTLGEPDERGRPTVEQTEGWEYWIEPNHPRAEEIAGQWFARYRHDPGVTCTQYRVEVPEGIEPGEGMFEFMDTLEWDNDWAGATIVRANDEGHALSVATAERMAEFKAGVA